MENIVLSKSEKVISDCHHFSKEGNVYFSVDYIANRKVNGERKKEPEFKIFNRSILPQSFDKKSDDEICQELKGKTLVTSFFIAL